ncbi:MAG: type IV pilus twitching motility protein PilT [Pseudomonadales bacterium]|jgi:twitching motility protein PilT|nr:type IV pilus twitching motility protein PilT [Pseudomonadales bacterium]
MNILDIMQTLVDRNGSDIHLKFGIPPVIRVDGELVPIEGAPALGSQELAMLIMPLMNEEQKQRFVENKEFDFAYQFEDKGRFRVNVFLAKGEMASCMRLIPTRIRTMEELSLPPIFEKFTTYKQGLVLVTGPTGEGKSTTLAALMDRINTVRNEHILTIEDPIEFIYEPKKSIISQRELHQDTKDWNVALRSALREDPNIVLVGEMRDYETMASAITVAETGHLVFATLHTATAAQTVDRIIDVFPAHQQSQIRQQLAATLEAVVSQRLLPRVGGGRVAAFEVMVSNGAIRNLIREGKTYQIDNSLQTGADEGNMLIETSLLNLVQNGSITREDALRTAFRHDQMKRLLGE